MPNGIEPEIPVIDAVPLAWFHATWTVPIGVGLVERPVRGPIRDDIGRNASVVAQVPCSAIGKTDVDLRLGCGVPNGGRQDNVV